MEVRPSIFLNEMRKVKKEVDEVILDFLPKQNEVSEIQCLYKMMRDYPERGGKGLRPCLCVLTCEMFGGRREQAMVTAAALEMFQNWILIHDDIEDNSDLRRGLPVLHRKYGLPLAINAGDSLHGKMWELLLRNARMIGIQKCVEIYAEFSEMVNETTEGQHIELSWVLNKTWDLTEEDYLLMVHKKAAWYTCVAPCRLGGIIAGTAEKDMSDLVPFGLNLGAAFQIRDDILNLKADQAKYGKEVGGDLLEGKRTLILLDLLSKCSSLEKKKVVDIMSKEREKKQKADLRYVLTLIQRHGSIEYAERKAEILAAEAKRMFGMISEGAPGRTAKTMLGEVIDFMTSREF